MIQGRLQENIPSDATALCFATPTWPMQNMPQKTAFLPQGLAIVQFNLLILFIHVPQKCMYTLFTQYRASPSASDIQYSLFF